MDKPKRDKRQIALIIIGYPFCLLIIGLAINMLAFGLEPITISIPAIEIVSALIIASVLLVINHAWLMTTTELTRLKHTLYATPEEWAKSGGDPQSASALGMQELERRHNAHRNTTENAVYFCLLAALFTVTSPSTLAAQVWLIGFAIARLGYTYSYIAGRDNLRGVFMSLSLLAMFGLASYLLLSLVV